MAFHLRHLEPHQFGDAELNEWKQDLDRYADDCAAIAMRCCHRCACLATLLCTLHALLHCFVPCMRIQPLHSAHGLVVPHRNFLKQGMAIGAYYSAQDTIYRLRDEHNERIYNALLSTAEQQALALEDKE